MKSQPVEFLEPVEPDLRHARAFYESWQFQGAERFHSKFRDAIAWIEWNPETFPEEIQTFPPGDHPQNLFRHLLRD